MNGASALIGCRGSCRALIGYGLVRRVLPRRSGESLGFIGPAEARLLHGGRGWTVGLDQLDLSLRPTFSVQRF